MRENREPTTTPVVTCVIVGFHRPDLLTRLLTTLADPRIEIIVVNMEDDPAIRSLPGAEIVAVATNVGYAAGVNLGARKATADVMVFMNDDVAVTAADVLAMGERVRSGNADVVVPLVENQQGELELAEKPPYRLAARMQLRNRPVPAAPLAIDAAWAVIVALRTELMRSAPMPEDYFLYWEELEWFHGLRSRGFRVELLPSVRILHYGGLKVARPDKSRLMARNAVRCVRRVRGRGAALRAWPHVVGWQTRLLLSGFMRGADRNTVRSHAAGVGAAVKAWREI
jgi:GT2 family glycosyltransferase